MGSSTAKGNKLEDALHRYLLEQQERGELVFDLYPAQNCRIYKKKEYFDDFRGGMVQFDVVIETYRSGRDSPHSYIIFECKNHKRGVSDDRVREFSHKIEKLFHQSVKGVVVVTSRLQSGAENVARSSRMGIVKFDERGFDVIAERKASYLEARYVRDQISQTADARRSLKFSAFEGDRYFGSVGDFIAAITSDESGGRADGWIRQTQTIPFIQPERIKAVATNLLEEVGYSTGAVDLNEICRGRSITLKFTNEKVRDIDGREILGSADFGRRIIEINSHSFEARERFTIGHEIGHFVLNHGKYLRSESIIESDLHIKPEQKVQENLDRLEYQANTFASELILPEISFRMATDQFRKDLNIRNRGHGYIFVDDQPENVSLYDELLGRMRNHFSVSKRAIEIKFKKLRMLNDQRKPNSLTHLPSPIGDLR